jgi:hypothetical protein
MMMTMMIMMMMMMMEVQVQYSLTVDGVNTGLIVEGHPAAREAEDDPAADEVGLAVLPEDGHAITKEPHENFQAPRQIRQRLKSTRPVRLSSSPEIIRIRSW